MTTPQYATIADLESSGISASALAKFTDEQKNDFLLAASSEADCSIPQRYKPLTTWPQALRTHVAKHAAYLLISARGFNPNSEGNLIIVKGYDDAIAFYGRLARGSVTFPRDEASPAPGGAPSVASSADSRELDLL